MAYDRSPLWIQEIQIALEQASLDRLDRAIDELVRLGWNCERYRVRSEGSVEKLSIRLDRTMEAECP